MARSSILAFVCVIQVFKSNVLLFNESILANKLLITFTIVTCSSIGGSGIRAAIIFSLDIFTQNYTKNTVDEIVDLLSDLKENILNEDCI